MKKLIQYIDEAKEITGSDYRTAQLMGVTRSAISSYRHGRSSPDEYGVFQLAKILGISERDLFIALQAQSEKNPDKRNFWEKLGGIAASIILSILFGGNLIMTPTPSQAAQDMEHVSSHCILC